MTKIPGSPRLHNFNVRVPERGSLGTRLMKTTVLEVGHSNKEYMSGASGALLLGVGYGCVSKSVLTHTPPRGVWGCAP